METGLTPEFSIVAIIAAFNEADIIGAAVSDLVAQGIGVYVLDDGSTDGTLAAVEPFAGRGVIGVEQLSGPDAASKSFHWERILRRKSELAAALDGDWFIHHDADEFRESPWRGVSLADGVRRADALGYNAIDFLSVDFRPVDDRFRPGDDPRSVFQYHAPHAPHDRVQVRCWKKTGAPVDLASSGGHDAAFAGRRVFPLRFILRHYPIRSQAHGERKVFGERQRRYLASERGRGWHVQYDAFRPGDTFLADPSTLIRYDPDAVRVELALRHRGVEALEAAIETIRADAERSLAERDRQLTELRDLDAATRGELVKAHTALAEAADYATRLTSALAAAHAATAAGQAHLEAVTSELAAHRQSLESVTRQLHDVHQSLSWRLSAPLRALFRLVTGR
jgi:glycosyltransferase involved in cell wall biosynthesis